jgi:protein SCO1/2
MGLVVVGAAAFLTWPKSDARTAHDHLAVALVNQQGVTVDMRDYRGKFLLVYFGYSQCRRDCPQALGLMSHTLEMLGNDKEVQALFISLDAARDTPVRLERFMQPFHPAIEALAFSDRDAMKRMSEVFELFTAETSINSGTAAVTDHEPAFFLLDRSGEILDRFDFPVAPEEIIGAIKDHQQDGGISI